MWAIRTVRAIPNTLPTLGRVSPSRDGFGGARYFRRPMIRSLLLVLVLSVFATAPSHAQGGLRDTTILVVPISISYAYQIPYGDMALRFGANSNIGLSAGVKFKNNYYLGLEGSFIFGTKVNEANILQHLITTNGVIVDQDGKPATVVLYERGYTIMATAGKIIPIVGPNPNSGMFLKIGGGYMRHKIRIETQDAVVPALEGEYQKGYDRLCAGPMVMLFAGYQHISNNRFINFVIGWEVNLGFTNSLRPFNFDTGRSADGQRADGLNGIRFGWTLPLFHKGDDRILYH